MIKIGKNQRFYLTEHGKKIIQSFYRETPDEKNFKIDDIEIKYNLANDKLQHSKSFGTDDDYRFCSDCDVCIIFNKNTINVNTSCYGGMAWLIFDESNLKTNKNNTERETMDYTIKLIKKLKKLNIVI